MGDFILFAFWHLTRRSFRAVFIIDLTQPIHALAVLAHKLPLRSVSGKPVVAGRRESG